jgi:hypothetical protein
VHIEQMCILNPDAKEFGIHLGRGLQKLVNDHTRCIVKLSQPHIHRANGPMFRMGDDIIKDLNLVAAKYGRKRTPLFSLPQPSTSADQSPQPSTSADQPPQPSTSFDTPTKRLADLTIDTPKKRRRLFLEDDGDMEEEVVPDDGEMDVEVEDDNGTPDVEPDSDEMETDVIIDEDGDVVPNEIEEVDDDSVDDVEEDGTEDEWDSTEEEGTDDDETEPIDNGAAVNQSQLEKDPTTLDRQYRMKKEMSARIFRLFLYLFFSQ